MMRNYLLLVFHPSFTYAVLKYCAGMYNEGFIFCEKVKERLDSSDDYQAFLKCLHMYSNGIIKRTDLQCLVGCLSISCTL